MLGTSEYFLYAYDSSILIDETNNLYVKESYTDPALSTMIILDTLTDSNFNFGNSQATILPSSIFNILQENESATSIPLNTFFTKTKDLTNSGWEFNMINHIHIPTQVPTGEIIPRGSRILYPIPTQTVTQYTNNYISNSDPDSSTIPSVFRKIPADWRYYISDDTKLDSVTDVNQLTGGFVVSYSENGKLTSNLSAPINKNENITFNANVSIGNIFMAYGTANYFQLRRIYVCYGFFNN